MEGIAHIIQSIPDKLLRACCSNSNLQCIEITEPCKKLLAVLHKIALICTKGNLILSLEESKFLSENTDETIQRCYKAFRRGLAHGCTIDMAHGILLMCIIQHLCRFKNITFSINVEDLIAVLERGGYLSYDGTIVDSLRHCTNATCTFVTGSIYNGGWVAGKMNGHGMMFNHDKIMIYNGNFVENEFSGMGEYFFVDHDKVVKKHRGVWLHNMRHGFGVETCVDSSEHRRGRWQNDVMLGFGEHRKCTVDNNGQERISVYVGNFEESQYSGLGRYSQWIKDSTKEQLQWSYTGFFAKGKRNGPGYVITNPGDDSPSYTCNFNSGQILDKRDASLHDIEMYQVLDEQITDALSTLNLSIQSLKLDHTSEDDEDNSAQSEYSHSKQTTPLDLLVAEAGGSCLPRRITRLHTQQDLIKFRENKNIPYCAIWTAVNGMQYSTKQLIDNFDSILQNLVIIHKTSEDSSLSQSDCHLWTPFCKDCRTFMLPNDDSFQLNENNILDDPSPTLIAPGQMWTCQGKCSKLFWTCALCTQLNEIQLFHCADRANHVFKKHNSQTILDMTR